MYRLTFRLCRENGFILNDDRGIDVIITKILRDIPTPIAAAAIIAQPDFARVGIEQIRAVSGAVHPAIDGIFRADIAAKGIFSAGSSQVTKGRAR